MMPGADCYLRSCDPSSILCNEPYGQQQRQADVEQRSLIFEDTSQPLPERSSMDPIFVCFCLSSLELSYFPKKMDFWRRSWATFSRETLKQKLNAAFGEINDSVVKSERGKLVRGSDLPLVLSAHATAGDVSRAPTRLLLQDAFGGLMCEKQKHSRSSPNRRNMKF